MWTGICWLIDVENAGDACRDLHSRCVAWLAYEGKLGIGGSMPELTGRNKTCVRLWPLLVDFEPILFLLMARKQGLSCLLLQDALTGGATLGT
jgi:hypothetical protein